MYSILGTIAGVGVGADVSTGAFKLTARGAGAGVTLASDSEFTGRTFSSFSDKDVVLSKLAMGCIVDVDVDADIDLETFVVVEDGDFGFCIDTSMLASDCGAGRLGDDLTAEGGEDDEMKGEEIEDFMVTGEGEFVLLLPFDDMLFGIDFLNAMDCLASSVCLLSFPCEGVAEAVIDSDARVELDSVEVDAIALDIVVGSSSYI